MRQSGHRRHDAFRRRVQAGPAGLRCENQHPDSPPLRRFPLLPAGDGGDVRGDQDVPRPGRQRRGHRYPDPRRTAGSGENAPSDGLRRRYRRDAPPGLRHDQGPL